MVFVGSGALKAPHFHSKFMDFLVFLGSGSAKSWSIGASVENCFCISRISSPNWHQRFRIWQSRASWSCIHMLYAGDGWYLPANLDGVAFFFVIKPHAMIMGWIRCGWGIIMLSGVKVQLWCAILLWVLMCLLNLAVPFFQVTSFPCKCSVTLLTSVHASRDRSGI